MYIYMYFNVSEKRTIRTFVNSEGTALAFEKKMNWLTTRLENSLKKIFFPDFSLTRMNIEIGIYREI